MVAKYFK